MTECGLIKKYGYYSDEDLQTIIAILNYEQRRDKGTQKKAQEVTMDSLRRCKLCGWPLPPEPEGKIGRLREYCSQCELLRARQRYRKWRRRRVAALC